MSLTDLSKVASPSEKVEDLPPVRMPGTAAAKYQVDGSAGGGGGGTSSAMPAPPPVATPLGAPPVLAAEKVRYTKPAHYELRVGAPPAPTEWTTMG